MKTKSKNVNMNLATKMSSILPLIEKTIKKIEGANYEMTITSGKDGNHMVGSKHYTGEAVDIRTSDMKKPITVHLAIKTALGKDYDVIYEIDHIHAEYDQKN